MSVTYKAAQPFELDLVDGDMIKVYGDTRRELWKAQLIKNGCDGYILPQHLQELVHNMMPGCIVDCEYMCQLLNVESLSTDTVEVS